MYYRHDLDYEYPERSDEHMIEVEHIRDTNFDENYDYVEKGFWAKIKKGLLWLLNTIVVFLVVRIRHGVKIHGRKNFTKNKKLFKNGAITIANHVFKWDYLCVLMSIYPHMGNFLAWQTNFEGPDGPLVRWAGGMPIPTHSLKAMQKFNKDLKEILESDKWLHVFPEGSMWYYYPDIRPFKKAVFKYAVQYDKPIIPIAFSFRPRKGIEKWFGKAPLVDVHIGEPILPDKTLPKHEAIDKMHKEAYHIMQTMVGLTPDSPTYNTDQNIDTYQKTM